CTASDTATPPNTATCSFTVTVNDTEKPTVTCPADIVVSTAAGVCSSNEIGRAWCRERWQGVSAVCNPARGTRFNKGASNVTFTVSATDNCPSGSSLCTPARRACINNVASTVPCTASDTATPPNTATCSFTVTVNDTEKPTVTCPADIVVSTAAGVCSSN